MFTCPPLFEPPCEPYVTVADLTCDCLGVDPNIPADVALFDTKAREASQRVFNATAGKYPGCCEITFVPCRTICERQIGPEQLVMRPSTPAVPYVLEWSSPLVFANCWECSCACDTCTCWGGDALQVPYGPIREIIEIKVDGVTLAPANYTIVENVRIVRTDGNKWPSLTCGSDDGFQITYRYGVDLPLAGKSVLAEYVCELVKECKGMPCKVPAIFLNTTQRESGDITTFTRRGEYLDEHLLTGYPPLDNWIMSDRGGATIHAPSVWPPNPIGRLT